MGKAKTLVVEEDSDDKSEDLEIISIGALYNGVWDKKYWSSSRGKDRYPYPLGYLARRSHNGSSYNLEICEGPKGPLFTITSGNDSCSGQTPDIAWENFQKKHFSNLKIWHGKRFSCKIDGIEFFGFKTSLVQRLLRELVAGINEIAERSCSKKASTKKQNDQPSDAHQDPDVCQYLERPKVTRERSKRHKIIGVEPTSVCKSKRYRSGDAINCLETSNAISCNHQELIPLPPAHNKSQDLSRFHGPLDVKSVPEDEKNLSTVKDSLSLSAELSTHFGGKIVLPHQDIDAGGHENCESVMAGSTLIAADKEPSSSKNVEAEEQELGQTGVPSPKGSQGVDNVVLFAPDSLFPDDIDLCVPDSPISHDIGLCAPDSLMTENTTYSTSNSQDKSSFKDEVIMTNVVKCGAPVSDSHHEDEIGTSSSNKSNEKFESDSVSQDIAKSMMTVLLPQAIPLLKTTSSRKKRSVTCSQNISCEAKLVEGNNETGYILDHRSLGIDCSVVNKTETSNLLIPDSLDGKHCVHCVAQEIPVPCENFEVGQLTDRDVYPPCTGDYLVNEHEESPASCPETIGSKDIFCIEEVHMSSGKVQKVLEENQISCRLRPDEKDPTCSSGLNEDMDKCNGTNGTLSGVTVNPQLSIKGDRASETEEAGKVAVPPKVYTRKTSNAGHRRKYRGPLSESTICRKGEEIAPRDTVCTLDANETSNTSSLVEKPPLKDLSHSEPKAVALSGFPHSGKSAIGLNPVSDEMGPPVKTQMYACNSDGKKTLEKLSLKNVENSQALLEETMSGSNKEQPQANLEQVMAEKCNLQSHVSVNNTLRLGTDFCCTSGFTSMDLKLQKNSELTKGTESIMKLVGCYLHPMPISLLLLRIKGSEIYLCAFCGLPQDKHRSLFLYKLGTEEPRIGHPSLVGHTTVTLPSSMDILSREGSLEKNGLQLSPDGHFVVLLGGVKMPYCRDGRDDCQCSLCTSNCLEQNVIKIVEVKDGYVSVQQKLITVDAMHCILVCEPEILVAAGEGGRLHLWTMNLTWSSAIEEFAISTSQYICPCIVELKKVPNFADLVVGHNGMGEFTLWDIRKRIFISWFSAPGLTVQQFMPISMFNWPQENHHGYTNINDLVEKIMDVTRSWSSNQTENHCFDREDVAIWLLISAVSDSDYLQTYDANDRRVNPVGFWKLGLLAKNTLLLGSIFDPRATAIGTSAGHGIIGTLDGVVYAWELTSGTRIGTLHHFEGGQVSYIATDESSSSVLAVADDRGKLIVYQPT